MKKRNNNLLEMQFISFLSYFNAYIYSGNNVYQSISKCVDNLKPEIKTHVINLIDLMKDDKSIVPFKVFADKFENESINQIIIMIYQYSQNGRGEEQIGKMIPLLDKLKNITLNDYIKKESEKL
ncbi:MAG: hypothetical protein PHD50_03310, partial [Bacilli bacterium]|nr:hypothetical protein [Bacilli bacterium]